MKLHEQTIIHPHRMRNLIETGHFPSLCSIGNVQSTQDAANQPIDVFVPHKGMAAIPCKVEPTSGAETRGRQQAVELNQWLIGLAGYFPQIVQDDQADVDGIVYNIMRVAHDDHETVTYLTCEIVS
jgi:hypothetical protein